uniref:Seminal fluid protein n=1 Tax=Nilaparvata lugens TaxID=108931 RepID=A0A1I9WLB2_NILLU|nr:seminal fluid protein [Nilaparvata lugens]
MECKHTGKETQIIHYLGSKPGPFHHPISGATYQTNKQTVEAKCLVWLHIARCAIIYSDLPKHFEEVES